MIGNHIGPYALVERLGGGGFSTVYKAIPTQGGGAVAIKLLRPEYAPDDHAVRRFQREAETLLRLPRHPHVAQCLAQGLDGGIPYLVMEYLDGQDLSQVLHDRGRLPAREAIAIGMQVADALGAAHRAHVVHRDVKPQNIRLTGTGIVKLIDFGIARPPSGTRLTQTGTFIGTPQYIAPEVWEGLPADGRADLYSLGVVLYELLAGRVPFDGESPASIMRQHLQATPRPLTLVRTDLPLGLDSVILRALARDPSQRFQSAADLMAALSSPEHPHRRVDSVPHHASPIPNQPAHERAQLAKPAAYLLGQGGPFSLRPGVTMIGRHPRSDVLVDDTRVSAEHASIELHDGKYVLRDLGSRNGTFLNDSRISTPAVLRPGDQVRIGQTQFGFAVSGGLAAVTGARGRAQSSEARLAAALAHAGAVLGLANVIVPLVPLLLPLSVWAAARRTSPQVAFHARQALLFQGCLAAVLLVVTPSVQPWLWLAATAYAWLAAVRCAQGHDFCYPILSSLAGPLPQAAGIQPVNHTYEKRRDAH